MTTAINGEHDLLNLTSILYPEFAEEQTKFIEGRKP